MEVKKPRIFTRTFKKKNIIGPLTLSDLQGYYKGIVIKMVWYWH